MSRIGIYTHYDDRPPELVGWFDPDTSESFHGTTKPRPRARIGKDVQWTAPQVLYRTGAREWVRVTEFGGRLGDIGEYVSGTEARVWLRANGFEEPGTRDP